MIIYNFYSALILGGPSSEAQQNKIINHIQEPGTYSGHHQYEGPPTIIKLWKSNSEEISFGIFTKRGKRFPQDVNVVGSSFRIMGAATEKARLPRFSLVLGIESCCEVDDLSCLGMLDKCNSLTQGPGVTG